MQRDRLPYLLIPLAAFIATLPLLLKGCSCGHDFDFHILSWLEAARQFAHGNPHPHWAFTPAYDAGEPRFVFYPPASWTIGAVLGLVMPWTWTPIVYTWIALTASGLALHRLAREFASSNAAIIAAVLYTVNPYMLFTAYERTAYAELLAAAWIPLLLHAILRREVTIPRIAIPVALLWLTNAPAAVMSCYALALLVVVRLIASSSMTSDKIRVALNTAAGTVLGLSIAAFYIVPAAYERRFVQIAMAVIPNMRIQDNFLFHHTGDGPHDQVLHTASLISVVLIVATGAALAVAYLNRRHLVERGSSLLAQTVLAVAIVFLLTPTTAIIWNHAPELAFLQFPWRLLAILAAVLGLAIALALVPLRLRAIHCTVIALVAASALTYPAYAVFGQSCDVEDTVAARLALFQSNRGTEPTDEYTPTTADNDSLSHTDPGYWLSSAPNAKPSINSTSGTAPFRFTLDSPVPQTLVLNLRDYPAWEVTRNGTLVTTREHRDDGLIAFPVPAGTSTVAIAYAQTADQIIGDAISAVSLLLLLIAIRRRPYVAIS